MPKYELLCVLPGTLAENELPAQIDILTATITEQGGKDVVVHEIGKNRLAYPMKHIRYGYFYRIVFSIEAGTIPSLQTKLSLSTDLLRAIIHNYSEEKHNAYSARLNEMRLHSEKTQPAATEEEEQTEEQHVAVAPEAPEAEETTTIVDIDKKLDEILDQSIADA